MNKNILYCVLALSALSIHAQTWTDISSATIQSKGLTQGGIGGCSGVAVNRLTGDVVIKIIDNGIWRSSDKGASWTRIDNNTVSGRCETGVALNADQNNPVRMASFSLDGDCGYTPDGTTWHKFTGMGRNWDFGSVDWGTPAALVMLAAKHEDGGKVYKTTDGGITWILLSITVNAQNQNDRSMIGVIDPTTFIYCAGSGIKRSTDGGTNWAAVSSTNSRTKIPVLFKNVYYLGTSTGLLVSSDKGATWHTQGTSVEISQGPFFGADENTMMIVGSQGFYKTTNAGTTWTKVAAMTPAINGNTFDPLWFGGFSWDPINNIAYATRMVCPALKYVFTGTGIEQKMLSPVSSGMRRSTPRAFVIIDNRAVLNGTALMPNNGFTLYDLRGTILNRTSVSGAIARKAMIGKTF